MNRHWKEAASIIIAGTSKVFKNVNSLVQKSETIVNSNSNFKVLVLKRGKSSKFFPGGYVFPGGTVENADSSEEWQKLYNSLGFKLDDLESLLTSTPQTPLFVNTSSLLPKAIALRITAIRETFEESGILLCKSKKYSSLPNSGWASFLKGFPVEKWQKIIQDNPSDFINLCKEFDCFPDVWSLQVWSNWLTPTINPIRFDTAFFLTTLDQIPPSTMNEKEMDDIKWCSVNELLEGNKQETLWLPPPQFYEISRIDNFQNIEELNKFATTRNQSKCDRWMPFQCRADDGIISVLPGDEMYPENIKYNVEENLKKVDGTMENLRNNTLKLHRMELYKGIGTKICILNVHPTCGHLLPTKRESGC